MPDVKFCGMTRVEDARFASRIGARYVGVIRAGGPRHVDVAQARAVLDAAGTRVNRVAVFGSMGAGEIAKEARALVLDVIQLHADPTVDDVEAVREGFRGKVWAVCRVSGSGLPAGAMELARAADALVFDAHSGAGLGGSGKTLDWHALSDRLAELQSLTPVVLAGGLTAFNLPVALGHVAPAVVDVSSGVEVSPGIKDHELMRAFMAAATAGEVT